MATLEQRGPRFNGKRYAQSLNTTSPRVANSLKGGIEKTIMLLQQHALKMRSNEIRSLRDPGPRIRAVSGHSIALEKPPAVGELPEFLFHGTAAEPFPRS